jgi:hypothetical protein
MNKTVFVILLAFAFSNVNAALTTDNIGNAGFSQLSEAEKAEILKTVADKAALNSANKSPAATSEQTLVQVERFARLGKDIGAGLGAAAKELGIAVNEFATTPTGKLTTALIVWHIMGGTIVHVLGGLLVWIVGLGGLFYVYHIRYPRIINYSKEKRNIFGNAAIDSTRRPDMSSDDFVGLLISSLVIIVVGIITIFSY